MAAYDGYVTIGFKADKKQLESDIKEIERELKNYDKQRESLNKKISDAESNMSYYEMEIKHNEKLVKLSEDLMTKRKAINKEITRLKENGNSPWALIQISNKEKEYDRVVAKYNEINGQITREADKLEQIVDKYEDAKANLSEWKNELKQIDASKEGLIAKTNQYVSELNNINFLEKNNANKMSLNLSNIGKSMDKIIIRSAYSLIQRSISVISQYDEQLATDIEYIRFALATTLKPFVEWLVDMVMKLLKYVGRFIYDLTGVNIFANATADAFNRTTKSVKDLKKQLAGFDEMNVLSDTGTSGTKTPSIDLSQIGEPIDYEGMYEKAKKAWINIKNIFFNGWETIKKELTDRLRRWGISEDIISGVEGVMDGIAKIVRGAIEGIEAVIKFFIALWNVDAEGVKKAFEEMINAIWTQFQGFIQVMLGQLGTFLGTIRDLVKGIWNWIKGIFKDSSTSMSNSFSSMSNIADGVFKKIGQAAQIAWNVIKNSFGNIANWFQSIFSDAWNRVKNVFSTGGVIFDGIKDGIEKSFKTIVNKLIDGINRTVTIPFEKLNETLNKIHDVNILGLKPFSNLWSKNPISVPKIPKLRTGAILNMPGKGVYHNGAFVGDGGAEGIIPLTDKSAMELLGRLIGENVVINATMINEMNGRIISKELLKVQNQSNFASNI